MKNKTAKLLSDHNITFRMRNGWYNVCCPFCLDHSYHLGISEKGYATCFKCGWHSIEAVFSALFGCSFQKARHIARTNYSKEIDPEIVKASRDFKVPSSGKGLSAIANEYLRERFSLLSDGEYNEMVAKYQITSTAWDYEDPMYANRVIFPNLYKGKAVSWQGRDYTGTAQAKYILPKKENEIIFHKSFLWGIDFVPYDKVIVCEGVMDALSIGAGAVHTHGVKWNKTQASELMGFKEVFICYDSDEAGEIGAKSLAKAICHRTKVHIVKLSGHDLNSCSKQELDDVKGLLE
jgi:5S rRNA maturation endonuclease (ribonuclease M5)